MILNRFPLVLLVLGLAICVAASWGLAVGGGGNAAPEHGFATLTKEDVDAVVLPFIENGTYAGMSVGLLDDRGSLLLHYGAANLSTGRTADDETVYEIGSVTKTFTGLLLADAGLRGEVTDTAPLALYLPSGTRVPSFGNRSITLLDLATHTSGLPNEPPWFDDVFAEPRPDPDAIEGAFDEFANTTPDAAYGWFSSYNLTRPVGSQWEYSNVGAAIVGDAVARRANQTYPALVRERVLLPLGMTRSSAELEPWMMKAMAIGYRGYGSMTPARTIDFLPFWSATGGMRSTPADMMRYLAACTGTKNSSLSEAINLSIASRAVRTDGQVMVHQGYLWDIVTLPDGNALVMKTGETNGFQATIAFSRNHRVGIFILANTARIYGPSIDELGLPLLIRMCYADPEGSAG
jgi:CubicO group peptidase (beta-lactamase class C family)